MSRPIDDTPPDSPQLTPYDEAHLVDYLRLLDADAEGAPWQDAARIVLGLDPADPRAEAVHAAHLARARWMTESGYRGLTGPAATADGLKSDAAGASGDVASGVSSAAP